MITGYQGNFNPGLVATIPISTQISNPIPLSGFALCGIIMPAAFTGTSITFTACNTISGTYLPVFNASGAVTYTVAANQYQAIDPKDFQGIQFLIIKSNSSEAAARSLALSLRGF